MIEPFQGAFQVDAAEGPRRRARMAVLVPRGEHDRGERDRHQHVPLPPRRLPRAPEGHRDQGLGEEHERHRDGQRQRTAACPVDPQVPPRREQVRRHAERQQHQQPRRAFGLDHAVERSEPGQRGRRPHEQHDDEAHPHRRLPPTQRRLGALVHLDRGEGRERRRQDEADGRRQHEPAVRPVEHHAGRGQRVQRQEARAGEQHHGHQEEPLVAAPASDLAHDQAERDVQQRDAEHEPEVRRMVLPVHVERREAQHQGQSRERDDQRGREEPG